MNKMKAFAKKNKKSLMATGIAAAVGAPVAMATPGTGTGLDAIYTQIQDIVQGPGGKIVAIALLATSLYMGVVSSNLMGALGALGAGLILANAGTIMDQVFTAVI